MKPQVEIGRLQPDHAPVQQWLRWPASPPGIDCRRPKALLNPQTLVRLRLKEQVRPTALASPRRVVENLLALSLATREPEESKTVRVWRRVAPER
jgi:hypothetical protein